MKLEYDREQVEEAVHRIVKRTMQMDLTWDWPCGVAYYGVAAAYERTGKKEYLELLQARVDELISLGLPETWTVNTCAMGHCLMTLYEAGGQPRYRELLKSKIEYLRTEALRFGNHVLQHTVSPQNDFPEQAWADTLFMAAYLMLRYGVAEEDTELIQDALNQWYWHINYLQDPESAFFYHGYDNISKGHRGIQGNFQKVDPGLGSGTGACLSLRSFGLRGVLRIKDKILYLFLLCPGAEADIILPCPVFCKAEMLPGETLRKGSL